MAMRGSCRISEAPHLSSAGRTWCAPCITELPEFVTIHRMYRHRKLQLVTISMDEPDQGAVALDVLKKKFVSAENYHLDIKDRDRFADLLDKQWEGPLPYTLLIAPGGEILYRQRGEIKPLAVKRAIVDVLGRTYLLLIKQRPRGARHANFCDSCRFDSASRGVQRQ